MTRAASGRAGMAGMPRQPVGTRPRGVKTPESTLRGSQSITVEQFRALESEAEFRKRVLDLAEQFGWWWKYEPDSRLTRAGWPDLVLCRPPRFLLRELKKIGGKASSTQLSVLAMLRASGIDAEIWRPDQWSEIERTLTEVA